MGHGEKEHTALHVAVVNRIPHGTSCQADFAPCDFPYGPLDARGTHQVILRFPAQDEAKGKAAKGPQPRTAAIPSIKHMHHSVPPALCDLSQEFAVLIFFVAGQGPA
jgi:hypothetical protein